MPELQTLDGLWSIIRLPGDADIPDGIDDDSRPFVSITRTLDELSIVCPADRVSADLPATIDIGWRCLRVKGKLDLSMTGVLGSLLAPLADVRISVFTISTFDTDYILVKDAALARAIRELRAAGHCVGESTG